MPNLIHLKDYSDIYNKDDIEYKYIKSEATKSRLMGVIGIRISYEGLTLYFHLDFEEYGFDRLEVSKEIDENITEAVMGGLGESLVEITLAEATSLIYNAIDVGEIYAYDVPLEFFEYEYLLDEQLVPLDETVYRKICPDIESDQMLINYYLMRTAGLDQDCKKTLLQEGDFYFEFLDEPAVLLKNEIIPYENEFICKSIIDYFDAYKMVVTKLSIKNNKVASCYLVEELVMTAKEASFQLNKKEFIMLFYLESSKEFAMNFDAPAMIKNVYPNGSLLTSFHKNNNHTKDDIYYLNGDIYGSFFITEHQLVVTCFNYDDLLEIKENLTQNHRLDMIAELEAENPILNRFISSGFTDFFDFLGE